MPTPPHKPNAKSKQLAQSLSGLGIPQTDIAILVGVNKLTLLKYYRDELDKGMAEANAKVATCLFQQATSGNSVAAAIFWSKARLGWSEKTIISGDPDNPIQVVSKIEVEIVDAKESGS